MNIFEEQEDKKEKRSIDVIHVDTGKNKYRIEYDKERQEVHIVLSTKRFNQKWYSRISKLIKFYEEL